MTRSDIEREMRRLLVEWLDVVDSEITPDAHFVDDLDADDLGLIEVIISMEESFGIDIPDEDIDGIQTLRASVDYVAARLNVGSSQDTEKVNR